MLRGISQAESFLQAPLGPGLLITSPWDDRLASIGCPKIKLFAFVVLCRKRTFRPELLNGGGRGPDPPPKQQEDSHEQAELFLPTAAQSLASGPGNLSWVPHMMSRRRRSAPVDPMEIGIWIIS